MPTNQKMTPQLKAKWIELLTNGEYKQTRNTIHNDKGYCCLGVLNVAMSFRWPNDANAPGYRLPLREDAQNTLICMNNGHGRPLCDFLEIAAWIQENIPVETPDA